MNESRDYCIEVSVRTRYLDDQSVPDQDRYAFAYTITLRNRGLVAAKLMKRHWVITDGDGKTEEVRGDGVVGQHPHLEPGQDFEYTSGAVLRTVVGSMHGSYTMLADDGTEFDAAIPAFTLSMPRVLH